MNLRDLTYLVALAETEHFGNAAKKCHVSQPSLSIQIKKLEERLGVTLVERTNKSVLFTEIGKEVAKEARRLLEQANMIKQIANDARDPFSGELNLGVIPTLTTYLLPHLFPELTKTESFPKLSIYLAENQTTHLVTQLKEGKLDAAIISLPIHDDDFAVTPLFSEELFLAVSEKQNLTSPIKANDMKNLSHLLIESGHCLHDQSLMLCHQLQLNTSKKIKAASLEILRYMVAANVGVTFMPALACQKIDGIQYLPIPRLKPKRNIGIIWRQTSTKTPLLNKLVGHIKNFLSTQPGVIIA
jgi:LysR family hydrogen peroxide-inducible transcriptional activator